MSNKRGIDEVTIMDWLLAIGAIGAIGLRL